MTGGGMMSAQPGDDRVSGNLVASVDDRLGLALTAASRAMESRYRASLTRLQLTYSQFQVMSVLWEDGSHIVGALADRLALDVSTISPLLKRLESRGLVVRRRDARDERRVVVSLTERGLALRAEEGAILDEVSVGTHLTAAQERSLVQQLQRLAKFLGS
ncbi:MAG TPA: MarR family winged helix-turn-helix transcriptional regulator [Lapillicoccus sp.]|nr:MarR family winged helix-turn-helix transcriptional regulator [Lapillicoccus sp.]